MDCFRRGGPFSAILLDIMMPRRNGFDTLREIRQINPDVPVLMLSGMSQPNSVVQAMRSGATDFLAKPISHADLADAIRKATELSHSAIRHPDRLAALSPEMFIGSSPDMVEVAQLLPRIAPSDVPVLIQGETGTGKEVIARQVHALSHGASRPFVKLNCAAIPAELIESELFGYDRGAFTGAFQRKPGLFELAHGGTMFLDEIGDMDIQLQPKLLQVLQDGEFRRVGGKQSIRVDVRVVAATHRNLEQAVDQNLFRKDLFYRLVGFTLFLPPLRDRREDIVPMADFLLNRHSGTSFPPVEITSALRKVLEDYDWPGNVRQLETIMKKYLVLRDPNHIIEELARAAARAPVVPALLPGLSPGPSAQAKDFDVENSASVLECVAKARDQAETQAILNVLKTTKWNRKQAAALLNIDYKALLYKIKKLEINDQPAA
jgi:two-component system response regulator AtoC